jgi:hypothetical protein
MKNTNELGIWMDYSVAYIIEFSTKPFKLHKIVSEFIVESESLRNTKKSILSKHYNKIGKAILNYQKIVLFGSSDAKLDFFDFLSEDERFLKLKIEIKDADKMNVNQQHDFIKEYFGQE